MSIFLFVCIILNMKIDNLISFQVLLTMSTKTGKSRFIVIFSWFHDDYRRAHDSRKCSDVSFTNCMPNAIFRSYSQCSSILVKCGIIIRHNKLLVIWIYLKNKIWTKYFLIGHNSEVDIKIERSTRTASTRIIFAAVIAMDPMGPLCMLLANT